jgi:hypothetical protein
MMKSIQKQTWIAAYDDNMSFNGKIKFPALTFLPNRYVDENLTDILYKQFSILESHRIKTNSAVRKSLLK